MPHFGHRWVADHAHRLPGTMALAVVAGVAVGASVLAPISRVAAQDLVSVDLRKPRFLLAPARRS